MKIMRRIGEAGFGLAEVMVAAGVMGGLSLALMRMTEQGQQGVARVEKGIEATDFDREVVSFIGVKSACNQTVGTPTIASISTTTGISLTQIKNENGVVVMSVGDRRGTVKLTGMRIHSYNQTTRLASFTKTFEYNLSPKLTQTKVKTTKISVLPDPAGTTMSTCIATSSTTDDVWTVDDWGIFYNDKTVAIGKEAGTNTGLNLDVDGNIGIGTRHQITSTSTSYNAAVGGDWHFILDSFPTQGVPVKNSVAFGGYGATLGRSSSAHSGDSMAIVGGIWNVVYGEAGFVGGGSNNRIERHSAIRSAILGGHQNTILGDHTSVMGSFLNYTSGGNNNISGGFSNRITSSENMFIGGGYSNQIFNKQNSAIVGGSSGRIYSSDSAVVGGTNNRIGTASATSDESVIVGGANNLISSTSAPQATIISGESNQVTSNITRGLIIGGDANTVGNGLVASTTGSNNYAAAVYSGLASTAMGWNAVVVGGWNNTANNTYSVVIGGEKNTNSGPNSIIIGGGSNGFGNIITTAGSYSALASGRSNTIAGAYGFIGSGLGNYVAGGYSAVIGGSVNSANATYAAILGGSYNAAIRVGTTVIGGNNNTAEGMQSGILGGSYNRTGISSDNGVVVGGTYNTASAIGSGVIGGTNSDAAGSYSTVLGGVGNTSTGYASTILGGWYNSNTSAASYSVILGGMNNTNSASYGMSYGRSANVIHSGAVVLKDNEITALNSNASDSFTAKFMGGHRLCQNSTCDLGLSINSTGELNGHGYVASTHRGIWLGYSSNLDWYVASRSSGTALDFGHRVNNIRMQLLDTGGLNIAGNLTQQYSWSDERLKDNLKKLENITEKIKRLNGYKFRYKKSGEKSIGVSAQELEVDFPELVYFSKRMDGDDTEYRAVRYELLPAILIQGFKEQQEEIEKNKKILNLMRDGVESRLSKVEKEIQELRDENKLLKEKIDLILKRIEKLEKKDKSKP
jgi:hypothetical protein